MFNPLVEDLSSLKDPDIESRIADLNKKYVIMARAGNGAVCYQLTVLLDQYKEEQQRRHLIKNTVVKVNKQDKDLGDLIDIG